MINKIELIIAAPHFLYPPMGGNDILVWERYTQLKKEYKNCIILGAEEEIHIQDGEILKKIKYTKVKFYSNFAKYNEALNVIFFRKNYLFCKYINKKFMRRFSKIYLTYSPKNIVLSQSYTLIAFKKYNFFNNSCNYICDIHNNDWEWFENLKKDLKLIKNKKDFTHKIYSFFFNQVCKISKNWLDRNMINFPENVKFSFLTNYDKNYFIKKMHIKNSFILYPQVSSFLINQKKYINEFYKKPKNLNLLFVGSLQVLQNIDSLFYFAESFYPYIKNGFKNLEISIVGRKPSNKTKKLCQDLKWNLYVNVSNKKLIQFYRKADFLILPFRYNNGFKIKFLESLANGTPIIGTKCVDYFGKSENISMSLFSDKVTEWISHIEDFNKLDNSQIIKNRNNILSLSKKFYPEKISEILYKELK